MKKKLKSAKMLRKTRRSRTLFIVLFTVIASVAAITVFAAPLKDPSPASKPICNKDLPCPAGSSGSGSGASSISVQGSSPPTTFLPPGCKSSDAKTAKPGDPCYLGQTVTTGSNCYKRDADGNIIYTTDSQGNKVPEVLSAKECLTKKDGFIKNYLDPVVNTLSGLVAVVIVGAIVLGGVQYSLAGNSPEAINKARQRIFHAFIALGFFLVIFAFLQWIVPGGVFNS